MSRQSRSGWDHAEPRSNQRRKRVWREINAAVRNHRRSRWDLEPSIYDYVRLEDTPAAKQRTVVLFEGHAAELPEPTRFTRADIDAMSQELMAEAPTEQEAFQRYIWDSDFARRVQFVATLKPTDEEDVELQTSLKATAQIKATLDVLPNPGIEWPEGDLPEQEPRSAENDDTVFLDDFDRPDTEYVDVDVNADVDSPLSVPRDDTRRAVRLLKLFAKAQRDLERKREVENTLTENTSWMPKRVLDEDRWDFIEHIHRAIERGENDELIQNRVRQARNDLFWNSIHCRLMSLYYRIYNGLFRRTG